MAVGSSRRLKIKPMWVANLLVLSCVGLFFYQLFGPDPKIVVSKATTHITAPLDEHGLPDYEAYWMQRASEGVTLENNAAVLIWQALWPGELDQEHWLPMCDALGMAEVPSEEQSLTDDDDEQVRELIAVWLSKQFSMPDEMAEEEWGKRLRGSGYEVFEEAGKSPWTSEEIPPLARWVEENKIPLDLLVEGAARSHYYSPSPSFLDGSRDGLISMLLPDIQMMRTAVRGLRLRAMHHLGDGRPAEAWKDLLACHRMARLAARNPTLIGQLVAIAIEGVACSGTQVLLHSDDLSERLAQQILDELQSLPPCSDTIYAFDQGERHFFLDSVLLFARDSATASDLIRGTGAAGVANAISRVQINWNLVMATGNSWYDRLATAAKLPTRAERIRAFDDIDADLSQLTSRLSSPMGWIGGVVSRNRRSEIAADVLLSLFLPAIRSASIAGDRAVSSLEMTRISAALAVHRARHGEYPEQLTALVPKILPEMPLDLYSGRPFIYQRKPDGGYLLYSVYENGVDDGGTDHSSEIIDGDWVDERPEDFSYGSQEHDLVIRQPVPEFELPDPPQNEDEWDY